ncbi:FliH/SctL family protein [Lysobacter korlensis]|uniref:Flagellar assembly protein FliH n=1 Tax=Lysobacter korlensis TaxID=553636 RepID=A0ABV6RJA7_9GAMM
MTSADGIVRWIAPGFDPPPEPEPEPELPPPPTPPSVEELQAIEQAAYDEGFERGHADGLAQGQAEIRRIVAQIEGILDSFTRPLARLDSEVGDALGDLAVRIAGSLVGRAYAADPTLLADLVREALDTVGSNGRDVELRLHPHDIGVLTPHLTAIDGVRLTGDNTLARGELRLHSESVRIDGTLATRLQACLQATLDRAAGA